MKTFFALFLAIAALTSQTANAVTLGDAVEGLCPEIKAELAKLGTLSAALKLGGPLELGELPAGQELVIMAPTDAAFTKALESLGLEVTDLTPSIAEDILKNHLAFAPAKEVDSISTLAGESLTFMIDGEAATLGDTETAIADGNTDVAVMDGSMSEMSTIAAIAACPDGTQSAFVIDTVLVPSKYEEMAAGPSMAPAAAPMAAPAAAPVVAPIIMGKMTLAELAGARCPGLDVAAIKSNISIFNQLIDLVGDTEVDVPAGSIVGFVPTDEAFVNLLTALNTTFDEVASNAELVTDILKDHFAITTSQTVDTLTTLYTDVLDFTIDGAAATLEEVETAVKDGNMNVMLLNGSDKMNNSMIKELVACPTGDDKLFVIDSVIVPAQYEPAPTSTPTMPPMPAEAPAPAEAQDAASTATLGFAAAVALVSALFA